MNTLQIANDLSVEQLATIVRNLSPEDRGKFEDLTWEIPDSVYKVTLQRMEAARKDPSRMIPWEEAKKMLEAGE